MYKNKYLKYKKKYLDSKLQYGGNDKWLNFAVRRFGINIVLETLHEFFSNYNLKNISRLSIGSGNAYLEFLYKKKFPSEPKIICIDPNPLSFNNDDLTKPFIIPEYSTVTDFKIKNPTAETVLLINWSGPDPDNTYDIDAIKLLKPVAFFIIYAEREYTSLISPKAGSDELINFLNELQKNLVLLEGRHYKKIREWRGEGSTLRLGWYIDWLKHTEKPKDYLMGKIFQQTIKDITVKLDTNKPFAPSGTAAVSSSRKVAVSSNKHYFISYDESNKLTPLDCNTNMSFIDKIKKILKKKIDIKFNNINFNLALRAFNVLTVLCYLQNYFFNFFNFDNIDLLSIRSGNGLFESLCQEIFGIPIICVEPNPPDLETVVGEAPFLKPIFRYTEDYMKQDKKKAETVLFLIWPDRAQVDEYDLEAIQLLKPLAFFIIYSDDLMAGSTELRKLMEQNNFKIGFQEYKKKLQINGEAARGVLKIALYVNDSKYQVEHDKSKYYKPSFIENYTKLSKLTIDLKNSTS
jgi:hypothetical protein